MKRLLCSCLRVLTGLMSTLASAQIAIDTSKSEAPAPESKATVEGLVRDIACPIQNLEATATHLSMKCLRACAKAGSPLAILTRSRDFFWVLLVWPLSDCWCSQHSF